MDAKPNDFLARLRAALKDYQETFEDGPLGNVLAKDARGCYLIKDDELPGLFFNDSPSCVPFIRAYLRIDGDPLLLEDFGAFLLRQSDVITADGTLVPRVIDDAWNLRIDGSAAQ